MTANTFFSFKGFHFVSREEYWFWLVQFLVIAYFLLPSTNNYIMERGHWFKFSFKRWSSCGLNQQGQLNYCAMDSANRKMQRLEDLTSTKQSTLVIRVNCFMHQLDFFFYYYFMLNGHGKKSWGHVRTVTQLS